MFHEITRVGAPAPVRLVLGVEFHAVTIADVVTRAERCIRTRERLAIGVLNATEVVRLRRDPLLRESLRHTDLVLAESPSVVWAAGALVSTADDIATFYRALLGGRLLSPELLRQMETTVTPAPGFSYGLGLQKLRGPCGTLWGHSGGSPGYAVDALNSTNGQRQVVVLVNATDPLTPSLKNFRSFNAPERAGHALERFVETAYCG